MPSVLDRIATWASSTLPYWEQAALEKVLSGKPVTTADHDELCDYLLQDAGLADAGGAPRPTITLGAAPPTGGGVPSCAKLRKLWGLRDVNALAPDQQITFGPQLTAIFGANGSGKSGYARVLGSAGFTRGDREVLGDVGKPQGASTSPGARVEIEDAEGQVHAIDHEVATPQAALRSIYVFDTTSVRAHLTKASTLSFSPAGLGCLTSLVAVTDAVRGRLADRARARVRPNPVAGRFPEASEVASAVATLGKGTNLKDLRKLATLSTAEQDERRSIDQRIAELRVLDVAEALATTRAALTEIRRLEGAIGTLEADLGATLPSAIDEALHAWDEQRRAAETHGVAQFEGSGLRTTGSAPWRHFLEAARALARGEAADDGAYPHEGDACLLCHRPLGPTEVDLLRRFWAFVEGDTASRLKAADEEVRRLEQRAARADLRAVEEHPGLAWLDAERPPISQAVRAGLAALRDHRDALARSCRDRTPPQATPIEPLAPGLGAVAGEIEQQIAELATRDVSAQRAELEQRALLLDHRARLGELLPEIEGYVADCAWAARAETPKVRGSSRRITEKHNELFTALVTDRYIALFREMLEKLGCPRGVRVHTKPGKGETRKQLVLETAAGVASDHASPDKVLSEGEQRAVALADFLTEVALDDQSGPVVLDDPVTSLDFEWKASIARHIVDEARRRQVIVFTHDLHFLYCLKEETNSDDLDVRAHWIQRRDDVPGWVFLDNSPVVEADYRKDTRVEQLLHKAQQPSTPPEEQQRLLTEGFGALRTCYEALVIFELFNEVVRRFDERISIGRLENVVADKGIRDAVIAKTGLLSRYIEGHLHSDRYLAQKPTTDALKTELLALRALRARVKDLKRQRSS